MAGAVLAVASDPGGARVVLPVLQACAARGRTILVVESPTLHAEAPPHWQRLPAAQVVGRQPLAALMAEHRLEGMVVGTGLQDPTPLLAMQQAQSLALPSLMMLDNWTSYLSRLRLQGQAVWPTYYGVMDALAYQEAHQEGVPKEILRIIGHPGLASLAAQAERFSAQERQSVRDKIACPAEARLVLFISEPVEMDQGCDPSRPGYRGYTEKSVLRTLLAELQGLAVPCHLCLVPHPREDGEALERFWQQGRGTLPGGLLRGVTTRQALMAADGVVGMASLVLYESWLLQRPTLSLQPGLCRHDLTSLAKREGMGFVDHPDQVRQGIDRWWQEMAAHPPLQPREELQRHGQAAQRAAALLLGTEV
jgi:hypothetical protein